MLLFIELQIFKTEQIGSLSPLFKGEGFFWGGGRGGVMGGGEDTRLRLKGRKEERLAVGCSC